MADASIPRFVRIHRLSSQSPFPVPDSTDDIFLALDIGNSAVKGGLFRGDRLADVFHLDVEDESGAAGVEAWAEALRPHLADTSPARAGLASVVPKATGPAQEGIRSVVGITATVIRTSMPLPFEMGYETPHTLGTDRLAAAAAAWCLYGQRGDGRREDTPARSVIAVDAGTAVTFDVVEAGGVYRGGAISAGPALTRQALDAGTAQLPPVPLEIRSTPMGRSTQEAIQSGIMWGLVDSVEGMIRRLCSLLADDPLVLVTGGWGAVLAEHVTGIDHVAPHLVLDGVRVLCQGHRPDTCVNA